jgi:hypothetical protein
MNSIYQFLLSHNNDRNLFRVLGFPFAAGESGDAVGNKEHTRFARHLDYFHLSSYGDNQTHFMFLNSINRLWRRDPFLCQHVWY